MRNVARTAIAGHITYISFGVTSALVTAPPAAAMATTSAQTRPTFRLRAIGGWSGISLTTFANRVKRASDRRKSTPTPAGTARHGRRKREGTSRNSGTLLRELGHFRLQ